MFVPNCAKIDSTACPNPAPYASSSTTVAIPHAMPTTVITVRRPLCRIASIACPKTSRTIRPYSFRNASTGSNIAARRAG